MFTSTRFRAQTVGLVVAICKSIAQNSELRPLLQILLSKGAAPPTQGSISNLTSKVIKTLVSNNTRIRSEKFQNPSVQITSLATTQRAVATNEESSCTLERFYSTALGTQMLQMIIRATLGSNSALKVAHRDRLYCKARLCTSLHSLQLMSMTASCVQQAKTTRSSRLKAVCSSLKLPMHSIC